MFYFTLFLPALIFIFLCVLKKFKRIYKTWINKKVPHVAPLPFFGNFASIVLRKKAMWQVLSDLYHEFYNERYFGFYQFFEPILVIKDPELIKQITVKDFHHFSEHSSFVEDGFDKIWSSNLFAMKTNKWKQMRPTLSPFFTSGKMKLMFQFMSKTSEQFTQYFTKQNQDEIAVELKNIFTKYTNDVIATTAYGLECNTMNEQENIFYLMGKKLVNFEGTRVLRIFIYKLSPFIQKVFNMKMIDDDVREFFTRVIYDTLNLRREKGLVRKDMIHLLLEAQKGDNIKNKVEGNVDKSFASTEEFITTTNDNIVKKALITDDDIVAQAMIFFIACFDTSSTLMSSTGYELMMNPDIQSKLREEIDEAFEKCNGNVMYEYLLDMKYLDMVISETLRKWPPIVLLDRKCVKTYNLPSINGEKALTIDKNMLVYIPVIGIHRDPKFYPNPDKFDPERFSDENKHKILPNTFLSFGNGPRNCIGSRFALLENKVMWLNLLRNFELVPSKNVTISNEWDPANIACYPINGYRMTLRRRKI